MAQLKITSWNLEWLVKLLAKLDAPPGAGASAAAQRAFADAQARIDAIQREILEIDPDILCIIEGPPTEAAISGFCQNWLGGAYVPITLPAGGDYRMKGRQWIWFLVRPALAQGASLLDPEVWQSYTLAESTARYGPHWTHGKTWPVNLWGETVPTRHGHYRHPQVLRLTWQDQPIELIGAHLKSKFSNKGKYLPETPDDPRHVLFISQALEARIKLATEASDIRLYLGQRFAQEANPAIFLMGDMNDGPGKELLERQYLFFDLIGNLQGDVFFARKFLNHALFDAEQDLRWSVFFKDKIDPDRNPHILLDHILFSQALVNQSLPIEVKPGAGKVEHEIHDRINAALSSKQKTSDHKPISCLVSQRV